MEKKDEMSSVGEILISKKFEQEAPEGFDFQIRRALRDKQRRETQQTQNINKSEEKNISLAK